MSEKEALPGANPIDSSGEVVFYQQEGKIQLPVRVENDTVWLTIEQMTFLFGKSRSTINEHILNAFTEGELEKNESVKKIGNSDFSKKPTNFYNLDVIISVGYRVKSIQGTQFRRWANQVLKEHLLKGFSVNQRLVSHENKLENLDSRVIYLEKQVDFFVKANLPPSEGLLPANAQWSGYEFAVQLVRSAKRELVIIDPYANDMVLSLMSKRAEGVQATIYSARITRTMREEEARLNRQFPTVHLENMREVHDRFVIVDDVVYHVGASFKDLGNQMTAFSVLNFVTKEQVLAMVK
jgi:hypothetical protein